MSLFTDLAKDMNDSLSVIQVKKVIPAFFLVCLLWLSFMVLQEFLITLAWAMIITYVMWQPYQYLKRRLKNNAMFSALVMTILIAIVILVTTSWLAAMLQSELKIAYSTLVDKFGQGSVQLPDLINRTPWLRNYVQGGLDRLGNHANMAAQFANWSKQWLGLLAQFLDGLGSRLVKFAVLLVTVFFCFRDGEEIVKQLRKGLIHFLGEYQEVYLQTVGDTTRAVVNGLLIAALAQGIVAGLGYAVAGVEAPVLFAAITGITALIPLGSVLVWAPISIMLILMDQFWQGIGLLLWGILVVSTIDNVIRPIVISGTSHVPFLVVMFGVLGGFAAFGVVGLFLGPVILSVLLSVWQAWLKQQDIKKGVYRHGHVNDFNEKS